MSKKIIFLGIVLGFFISGSSRSEHVMTLAPVDSHFSGAIHGKIYINHKYAAGAHVIVTDEKLEKLYGEDISTGGDYSQSGRFQILKLPAEKGLILWGFHDAASFMVGKSKILLKKNEYREIILNIDLNWEDPGMITAGGQGQSWLDLSGFILRMTTLLNQSVEKDSARRTISRLNELRNAGTTSNPLIQTFNTPELKKSHPQAHQSPKAQSSYKIVFQSDETGVYQIFTVNGDGSGKRQLTFYSEPSFLPRWSPDGKKIAFAHGAGKKSELYVMNTDGSKSRKLTNQSSSGRWVGYPVWSPDGTQIYFDSAYKYTVQIRRITMDGSGEVIVLDNPNYSHTLEAAISPDEAKIIHIAEKCCWTPNRIVMVYDQNTGIYKTLIPNDGLRDFYPSFDPSGQSFIWMRDNNTDPYDFGMDIWKFNLNDSRMVNLTASHSGLYFQGPRFSPDGEKIVLAGKNDGMKFDLYLMKSDGTNLVPITQTKWNEINADITFQISK